MNPPQNEWHAICFVKSVLELLRDSHKKTSDEVGDGKIFVHDMANAIRIRTNESGIAAL